MKHPLSLDDYADAARLDPDGMPTKEVRFRVNAWEHHGLQRLARGRCEPMQRTMRVLLRERLGRVVP